MTHLGAFLCVLIPVSLCARLVSDVLTLDKPGGFAYARPFQHHCLPIPVSLSGHPAMSLHIIYLTLDKPGGLLAHFSITASPSLCHYLATLHHARGAFLSILLSHYQPILYHAATMPQHNGSILSKADQTEYCSDFEHLKSSGLLTSSKVCKTQLSGDHN